MKSRFSVLSLLVILIFCQAEPVRGYEESPGGLAGIEVLGRGTRWLTQLLNLEGVSPSHAALTFDPQTGTPYLSFYDANNTDLWLAWRVPGGGNCGPNGTWQCEAVDADPLDDIGSYNSLDIVRAGDYQILGIAYHNETANSLKYLSRICRDEGLATTCTGEIETIISGVADLGMGTSLKLDPSGKAHIAYHGPQLNAFLGYAQEVTAGGSGCGGASHYEKWKCEAVDFHTGIGSASIDLDGDGFAYISYYDVSEVGGQNLKLAWQAAGGTCGTIQGNWNCAVIDGASGDDVGTFTAVSAPVTLDGSVFIAYYANTDKGALKFAQTALDHNGNCGNGAYDCLTIDPDIGKGLEAGSISLARLPDGRPVIAYYAFDSSSLASNVNLAAPATNLAGNCGIDETGLPTWRCYPLETAYSFARTGLWPSIAVNPNGMLAVAYTRTASLLANGASLAITFESYLAFLPQVGR